ncbi:WGR domain-containing protein [uncultured Legionella sp.]|uniref:WGR domain-containing protein n=1 Tax=uncultured Legionella sp. TaxID=210934 RepID=UPI0026150B75|nr:WGR domain-containing protein [uncultured Legionella sp.]
MQKEPYHYLRFEKESRYYELRLSKDLFEDWTLTTSNGRIKSKLGQSRTQAFDTFTEALTQLYATAELRHQRLYQMKRYMVDDIVYAFLLLHLCSHAAYKSKEKTKRKKTSINKPNRMRAIPTGGIMNQGCFMF